jgi:hypothetical protein
MHYLWRIFILIYGHQILQFKKIKLVDFGADGAFK